MAANAVEECLRYDAPVQVTSRVPSEDVEFHGARFAEGVEVDVILGAANRDPDRFENPERFDIRRHGEKTPRHAASGCGQTARR